jgi:hypothetical protein
MAWCLVKYRVHLYTWCLVKCRIHLHGMVLSKAQGQVYLYLYPAIGQPSMRHASN